MAHLRGSPEAAEALRRDIYYTTQELNTLISQQTTELTRLSESCRDLSYATMEQIINAMKTCAQAAMPELAAVHNRLAAYRDLILSLDGPDSGAVGAALEARGIDKATQIQWLKSHRDAMLSQTYQKCLGVHVQGALPEGYSEILAARHANAEPSVKSVFDHYANMLVIRDTGFPTNKTPHYSRAEHGSETVGVYYNAKDDINNPKGAGTTCYHELAHMIDHASTGFQGNLSNTTEFGRALVEDGQNILQLYNSLPADRKKAFLNRIRQSSAHSFSDLIDATTNGALCGSYGHTREYWSHPGSLQAEAFAHFFEASMGAGEKMEFLANFFPTAFGVFNSMIESIKPADGTKQKVLKRTMQDDARNMLHDRQGQGRRR